MSKVGVVSPSVARDGRCVFIGVGNRHDDRVIPRITTRKTVVKGECGLVNIIVISRIRVFEIRRGSMDKIPCPETVKRD